MPMSASPTHDATARTTAGTSEMETENAAMSAPAPSSHARVNGEKYAFVGCVELRCTDQHSDAATIAQSPNRSVTVALRKRRPKSTSPNISVGQTR